MIKVAICDDNKEELEHLHKVLLQMSDEWKMEIDSYGSGEELLQEHKQNKELIYDLYILDVEMSDMNGLELTEKIREFDYEAIFIYQTNYEKYMHEAFHIRTADYIFKPVTLEVMNKAFNKAKSYLTVKHQNFVFVSDYTHKKIRTNNIQYIMRNKRQITIVSDIGRFDAYMTDNEIFTQLDKKYFMHTHKSYIVNISKIIGPNADGILMENGDIIPVSRLYKKEFQNIYFEYIKEIV